MDARAWTFAFLIVCLLVVFWYFGIRVAATVGTGVIASIYVYTNMRMNMRADHATQKYAGGAQSPSAPLSIDDIPSQERYDPKWRGHTNKHIGQRKLILNEIQMLTGQPAGLVVYAGSAPSNKGAYLASLFDHCWIMVDPNPFDIKPFADIVVVDITDKDPVAMVARAKKEIAPKRIIIMNTYMTTELARLIADAKFDDNLYFISDIRTNVHHKAPSDADIVWNLAQQHNWVRALMPKLTMLKWRHPYGDQPKDEFMREINADPMRGDVHAAAEKFIDNYLANKLIYFPGKIMIQPWAGDRSTETRLISTREDIMKSHDHGAPQPYEEKLFYYNKQMRGAKYDNTPISRIGICQCADCAIEVAIWQDYIHAHAPRANMYKLIKQLSDITSRPLTKYVHV